MGKSNIAKARVPASLKELMNGSQDGYELKIGHFLELQHGLYGIFPAILKKTSQMIVVLEPKLFDRIRPLLDKRRSKTTSMFFTVNRELGVAFSVPQYMSADLGKVTPHLLLTKELLIKLLAAEPEPFAWARGLL